MHHALSTDPNCISQRAVQPGVGRRGGGGGRVPELCRGGYPLRSPPLSRDRPAEAPGPYDKRSCPTEVCVRGVFPQSIL